MTHLALIPPTSTGHRSRRRSISAGLLAAGLLGVTVLSACSSTSGERPAQAATMPPTAPPETVPLSTVPLTTLPPPMTEPPATEPAATEPPATEPPVTTPPHVVPVARPAEPIVAVGGSSGAATAAVQARLLELGFWVNGVDGSYGLTTRQAVMAFQKYWGLNATGSVDDATAFTLSAMNHRAHGKADSGDVVEIDKSRQILFIVKQGRTIWTLNVSTGTEVPYEKPNKNDPTKIEKGSSITPVGTYEVNRQRVEGWWDGDLGSIYRPKYFVGGVAIHGSNSIPNYPASHGCVRVSVPAMDMIWDSGLIPMRSTIWVHGEIPR